MDRLRCLQIFAEVARGGSFVRAARRLSLSKATVTKHVAALEEAMGAQLLKRTTKQVSVTDAGARVLAAGVELLDRYDALETDVRDATSLPRGSIRVGTPPSFGTHHLMRAIVEFVNRYPDIQVTVTLDDGKADLVAESLDLSIRIAATLDDASYVSQPLMKAQQVLVASPAYLRSRGTPRSVAELARHNCLTHVVKSPSAIWRFAGDPPQEVKVWGRVKSNLGDALKQATLLGAGISLHPYYMVAGELRSGLLEKVLPEAIPEELVISVVYSTRRNMPSRVRHLLEFLKAWGQTTPEWAAAEPAMKPVAKAGAGRAKAA